uniref:Uncharacterized protein n=1 Tax=Ditylenchus dipsaci TaxID=166011 RepID=A0A915EK86_9BILA
MNETDASSFQLDSSIQLNELTQLAGSSKNNASQLATFVSILHIEVAHDKGVVSRSRPLGNNVGEHPSMIDHYLNESRH